MFKDEKIFRIVDANLNRTKEALRVCEDIARFILNQKTATAQYKNLRHRITGIFSESQILKLLKSRDILYDVGKKSTNGEFHRKNVKDIFYANSQRAKESIRVLEEFGKLMDRSAAERLKKIRYQVYELEKTVASKI